MFSRQLVRLLRTHQSVAGGLGNTRIRVPRIQVRYRDCNENDKWTWVNTRHSISWTMYGLYFDHIGFSSVFSRHEERKERRCGIECTDCAETAISIQLFMSSGLPTSFCSTIELAWIGSDSQETQRKSMLNMAWLAMEATENQMEIICKSWNPMEIQWTSVVYFQLGLAEGSSQHPWRAKAYNAMPSRPSSAPIRRELSPNSLLLWNCLLFVVF